MKLRFPAMLPGLMLLAGQAGAASLTPYAGYTLDFTDNVGRVAINPESDVVHRPVLGVDVRHEGSRLSAQGMAEATYYGYTRTDRDSDAYYRARGAALWQLVEGNLNWVVEDYASIRQVDRTRALSPENREQRNIFITGPDLRLRLGRTNDLEFRARYGNFYYQRSDIDNDRWHLSTLFEHRLSSLSAVMLEYAATRTDFARTIYADYLRNDLRLGFARRIRRGMFSLDLGYTRIDEEGRRDPYEGNSIGVVLDRYLTRTISLGLYLHSELTDTGLADLGMGVVEVSPRSRVAVADAFSSTAEDPLHDIYRQNRVSLRLRRRVPDTILSGRLWWREETYRNLSSRDVREDGLRFDIEHRLGRSLGVTGHALLYRSRYPALAPGGVEDREFGLGAELGYQFTPEVRLSLGLRRYQRDSSDPLREYTENRVLLSVSWQPRRPAVEHGVRRLRR